MEKLVIIIHCKYITLYIYINRLNSGRYQHCIENTYANINTATNNNNKSFKSHLTSKKRTSAYTISSKTKKMSSGLLEHKAESNNRYSNSNINIINNVINECTTPPKVQYAFESSNSNLKVKQCQKGKKGGCISKCCIIL